MLRAVAVMTGAAAIAPLLDESAMAQAGPSSDADALFQAGEFEQAGRAYEEILKNDPNNVAERALRPAVLWRKGSFGSDSDAGSRFPP